MRGPSRFVVATVLPPGGERTIADVTLELSSIYASTRNRGGTVAGNHVIGDAENGEVTYIVSEIPI